jgi:hypothetical protein
MTRAGAYEFLFMLIFTLTIKTICYVFLYFLPLKTAHEAASGLPLGHLIVFGKSINCVSRPGGVK